MASSEKEWREALDRYAADSPRAARAMRVLNRLAESLDVPVERFFEDVASEAVATEDATELQRLYLAIADPALRRRCLAFVRAAAARPGGLSRSRRGRS